MRTILDNTLAFMVLQQERYMFIPYECYVVMVLLLY